MPILLYVIFSHQGIFIYFFCLWIVSICAIIHLQTMKFCIFSNINIFAPMALQPADKPISDNLDFHSKNYNWQHIHLKGFLQSKILFS